MNILINTLHYGHGGSIDVIINEIMPYLKNSANQIDVFCSNKYLMTSDKISDKNVNIWRHNLQETSTRLHMFKPTGEVRQIVTGLKAINFRPDIIWNNYATYALASSYQYPRCPSLNIIHSIAFMDNFPYPRTFSIPCRCNLVVRDIIVYLIEFIAIFKADRIIVLSELMRDMVHKYFFCPKKKILKISPGVNKSIFKIRDKAKIRRMLGLPPPPTLILLSLGRLVRRKNISLVIRSFNKVCRKYPESKLLIVGNGGEKPYLEKLVQQLELEKKVDFRDSTPEPWLFYSAADFFVLPSLFEPFGLVLLEAMSSGLPCIGLRSGKRIKTACEEIIRDSKTGFLVNNSVDDLANKIEILLENKQLRREMGEKSREICAKEYSWEKMANAFMGISKDIIQDHGTTMDRM
jgi:glycosyltransferase involved in cell wall biosynthesis